MKDNSHIDSERDLADALDRWGSDLDTWPRTAASEAKRLMASSQEATRLVQESTALNLALVQLREPHATPGLDAKILARLPARDGVQRVVDWLSGALWRPALAATIPLALGFILGITIPEEDARLADELSLLVFSETFEELEDDS